MARSLPSDKHTLVTHLRKTFGEVVAVVNNAPAFHESGIGLAMDIAGTQVCDCFQSFNFMYLYFFFLPLCDIDDLDWLSQVGYLSQFFVPLSHFLI